MSLALFQKVMDELGSYLYEVYLHNWGEPLLHPEIISMIRYAKRAGCRVILSTNLTLLHEARARELVGSGLDEVVASIDGATPETYRRYRVGGDFAQVLANLRLLAEAKRALRMATPRITWQFLVMQHNQHEIGAARQLAAQIGVDRLVFRGALADMGRERAEPVAVSLERDGSWLTTLEEYAMYDLATRRLQAPLPACDWLWTKAVVHRDGAVSPCCGVYDPAHDFGSVAHDSFRSQWNNPRFRAARRLMGRGQKSDVEVVCRYCSEDGIKP
jgi:MoaA/NifB/PqqE/SkfB family radical SAM enzyme